MGSWTLTSSLFSRPQWGAAPTPGLAFPGEQGSTSQLSAKQGRWALGWVSSLATALGAQEEPWATESGGVPLGTGPWSFSWGRLSKDSCQGFKDVYCPTKVPRGHLWHRVRV